MGLVGLVHTTRLVIDPVHEAIVRSFPEAEVNHVLDEGILRRLAQLKKITPEIVDWLTKMVASTEEAGADLAIVSCSSLSPCVNEVGKHMKMPVLKVDEPMMEFAVKNGQRVGLIMTNPTTEKPSQILFNEVSQRLGRKTLLVPRLCSNAFARLNQGDLAGHDAEVVEAVETMLKEVDLIMLAQISIARVRSQLDDSFRHRVLSSLDFIGARAKEIVGAG
ncbi:MAG: aspartate/glutamate racemase family protein [Desulfofustis sp.]|nr:aspartate/glutamate racemase family protein [Desulfofustis sp.]RZW22170.1 MAG: hypothetical protein EX260_05575 [Desulfobulbaceae bacterium]